MKTEMMKPLLAAVVPLLLTPMLRANEPDDWPELPDDTVTQTEADAWLDKPVSLLLTNDAGKAETPPAKPTKGPPLPVHTIEGYGGGAITPTAYLVNAGPKGTTFGLPAVSATGVYIGHGKNLGTLAITETLFGHVELGYGFSRFGIGNAKDAIKDATGVEVRDDVYLHNFNVRFGVLDENAFGLSFLPAVTVGVHYKHNVGIKSIDRRLGGALTSIGLDGSDAVDFTLTASKTFGDVFGHPLIVSAGLRNSQDAWLGYLGFSDERAFTFEANAIYIPTNWLAIAYEFRQKNNPYDQIPGLVGDEDDMHAFSLIWIADEHLTVALVYGIFGEVLNTNENSAVALQLKWEF